MQTLETTSKSNPGEVKAQKPSTRRTKVGKACDSCRRRKIKCNGLKPCPSCTIYGCECTYTDAKSTKNLKSNDAGKSKPTGRVSKNKETTRIDKDIRKSEQQYVPINANIHVGPRFPSENILNGYPQCGAPQNNVVGNPLAVNTQCHRGLSETPMSSTFKESNLRDDRLLQSSDTDDMRNGDSEERDLKGSDSENVKSKDNKSDPLIIYKDDTHIESTVNKLTQAVNELKSLQNAPSSIKSSINAIELQLRNLLDNWKPEVDFEKAKINESATTKSLETNLLRNKYTNHVHLTRFRIWIDYKNANKNNHFMGECGFSLAESFFASNQPLVDELFGLYSQVEAFSLQVLGYCVHLYEPYMKTEEAIKLMKETLYIILRFIDICVHHINEESISIANPLETYLRKKHLMPMTPTPRSSYGSPQSASTKSLVSKIIERIPQPFIESVTNVSSLQLLDLRDDESKMFGTLLNMCKSIRRKFDSVMSDYDSIVTEKSEGEQNDGKVTVAEFTSLCEAEEMLLALCYNYYNLTLYSFFEFGTNIEYMEHLLLLLEEQLALDEYYGFEKVLNVAVANAKKMGFHRWEFYVGYEESTAEKRRLLWWKLYNYEKASTMKKGFFSVIDDATVNCLLPKIFRNFGYLDRVEFLENIQKPMDLSVFSDVPISVLCKYGELALTIVTSEFHEKFLYADRYTSIRNSAKPPTLKNQLIKEIVDGIAYTETSYEAIRKQTAKLWDIALGKVTKDKINKEDTAAASKFTLSYEYHRFRLINMADNLIARLMVKPKSDWLISVMKGHLNRLYEHWKVMNEIILSMDNDYSIATTFEYYAPSCLCLATQTFLIVRNMEMDDVKMMVAVYKRFLNLGMFLQSAKVCSLADSHTFRDFSRSFSFITIISRLMIIEFMQIKELTKVEFIEKFSEVCPDLADLPPMLLDPNSCLYFSLLQQIKKSGFTLSFKKILEDARMMDFNYDRNLDSEAIKKCNGEFSKSMPSCTNVSDTTTAVSDNSAKKKASMGSARVNSTDTLTASPLSGLRNQTQLDSKDSVPSLEAYTPIDSVSDVPTGEINVPFPPVYNQNGLDQQTTYNLGTLDEFVNKGDLNELYNSLWGDLFSDVYL
uniref:Pdr1p n=1 Tax=Candida glabrata TaxID=5478 RepID=B9VI30_CANGB|nr:Pdr1p [Nakaseomyces glabratus]